MIVKFELRELTETWKNPHYDGRSKYGTASIKFLAAGTKLAIRKYTDDMGDCWSLVGHGSIYFNSIDAIALIARSQPVEPATWDEWRTSQGADGDAHFTNSEVLALLWQSPLTRRSVESAFAAVMAENAEEDM
jgi:hypothetical protein